jgi:hypothetical protein
MSFGVVKRLKHVVAKRFNTRMSGARVTALRAGGVIL